MFTNISTDLRTLRLPSVEPPQFASITISSNSPQASLIARAIQSARINQPGQYFADIGGILAVPQLTSQSPFLNWTYSAFSGQRHQRSGLRGNSQPASAIVARGFGWLGCVRQWPDGHPVQRVRWPSLCHRSLFGPGELDGHQHQLARGWHDQFRQFPRRAMPLHNSTVQSWWSFPPAPQ